MTAPLRAQQQEPAPPETPPKPAVPLPPPLPPRPPEVLMPDEGNVAIGVAGWLPMGNPIFDGGQTNYNGNPARIQFQGTPKLAQGGDITLPGGGHNAIRLSFFQTTASGNVTTPTNLDVWDTNFASGDLMATHYKLRDIKLSYEFVTWPYPVGNRHFRLKTLWQAQYVQTSSYFTAPLSATDTGVGSGSKNIFLPTLGLGMTYYVSRDFRIDASADGFGIPHHSTIADAEAAPAYKLGKIELRAGLKLFYFKTSSAGDYYTRGRLTGAFVGVRFYWR
jgi:hypothetical protein